MDKGTGEREKDGADVKQGSLAAYSIARETCRFCESPPPSIATSPLFLSLSLFRSNTTARYGSSSFSLSRTGSLALATVAPLSLWLAYLHP